ncbi:hypothetical protein K1W69_21195 [Hoeflea sp. WL0058]|uniref:Phage tail lysozyme domain-containing protein n=1 Tax=Flavimaribacter sediminis TaxID=2865987 RepID=A0AAE2ZMN6_9HYPH|nr:phage tail tip lysozyme [Flavimaribacter sediminis]MBW8639724.1 hypothetical protein [Flavimaribacter sediminis]
MKKHGFIGVRAAGLVVAALCAISTATPMASAVANDGAASVFPVAFKPNRVHFNTLKGYNKSQVSVANKIARGFAKAGYGRQHQIAAVSVAIRESTLNPKAVNRGCGCYGLFQLNKRGGLGRGQSVGTLTSADSNIALIIGEANRFPQFRKAKTVDQAVNAFVRYVTRPANKSSVVGRTVRTARMVEKHAQ